MSVVTTRETFPLVAVAIGDNNKINQSSLKWAIEHIVKKGKMLVLVHVNTKGTSSGPHDASIYKQPDIHLREFFLPLRLFCTRKDVRCNDVLIEDADVVKGLVEFITAASIEIMVLGSPCRKGILKICKNSPDVPKCVVRGAPDFCTVYTIEKDRVHDVRPAMRPVYTVSPLRLQLSNPNPSLSKSELSCAIGPPKEENASEPCLPSDNTTNCSRVKSVKAKQGVRMRRLKKKEACFSRSFKQRLPRKIKIDMYICLIGSSLLFMFLLVLLKSIY